MKFNFPADGSISDSIPLWRYFKLPRFEALIHNKALYFPRWDTLGERFEGSYPDEYIRPKDGGWGITPWGRGGWGAPTYDLEKLSPAQKNLMYICCFFNKDHESTLMWKEYSEAKNGVAIKTSVKRLLDSFRASIPSEITITRVQYTDFENDPFDEDLDLVSLFSLKRIEFAEEKEIRLLLTNDPPIPEFSERGGYIRIDPQRMIEEIILYPEQEKDDTDISLLENVKQLLERNDLEIPIRKSTLSKAPNF